jgi:hypothetical protein
LVLNFFIWRVVLFCNAFYDSLQMMASVGGYDFLGHYNDGIICQGVKIKLSVIYNWWLRFLNNK